MKNILFAYCLIFSVSAFAQQPSDTPANPASDADKPTGTIAPATQKQLKSVKKPKKITETHSAGTTTPTTTPSH